MSGTYTIEIPANPENTTYNSQIRTFKKLGATDLLSIDVEYIFLLLARNRPTLFKFSAFIPKCNQNKVARASDSLLQYSGLDSNTDSITLN